MTSHPHHQPGFVPLPDDGGPQLTGFGQLLASAAFVVVLALLGACLLLGPAFR